MKKTILFIILLTFTFLSNAQESDVPNYDSDSKPAYSKFYIGIGIGLAVPGGEGLDGLKSGINLKFLDVGYRFNENWGVTIGLDSSGFPFEDSDIDAAVGVGRFAIGPMYTIPFGGNLSLDIKPKYAFAISGVIRGDNIGDFEDLTYSGSGFVFANSLVFKLTKGFTFSVDLDYTFGKFNEAELNGSTYDVDTDEDQINVFSIGAGLRYNF